MRLTLLLLIALSCFAAACGSSGARERSSTPETPAPPPGARTIALQYDSGTLHVEVAQTPDERGRGLGFRDALAEDSGMLFDLGRTRVPGFWMKGMKFALDMVWIDEGMRIVGVTEDVQPEPGVADAQLRRYSPDQPVRYVLELNAGAARRLGIEAGERVTFELPQVTR
ncbi:MAG TPA: DUF192 domain-containing protein [Dehalococcoidia bacterium]|nr:DUF192 domain-containing protein [Dehalococcoidia bacterium]